MGLIQIGISAGGSGTLLPWSPNTDYTKGQQAIAPDGSVVAARRTFTSSVSYSQANWRTITSAPVTTTSNRQQVIGAKTLDDLQRYFAALPGVVSSYLLQERAGVVAYDAAGNNDGVVTGSMILGVDGPQGGVAMVGSNAAGAAAAFVNVPHFAAIDALADVFSTAIIFRRRITHPANTYVLWSKGTANWQVGIENDKVRVRKNGTANVFVSNESISDVHKWHLLVVRKNGATVSVRLDGVELTNNTGTAQTGVANTTDLQIGEATAVGALALAGIFMSTSYWTDAAVVAGEALWTTKPAPVDFVAKIGTHGERRSMSSNSADRIAINTLMAANHAKVIRSGVDANVIYAGATEPVDGDWARPDAAFAEVEQAGMENLLVLRNSPQWMNGSADGTVVPGAGSATAPAFLQWLEDQARIQDKIVRRYMPGGAGGTNVRLFECWNEPNLANAWKSASVPSAAQYAAYWARMKQVFAFIDPDYNTPSGILRFAFGALASPRAVSGSDIAGVAFLRSCLTAGATFPLLSVHTYDGGDPTVNSGEGAGKSNDFMDLWVIRDELQQAGLTNVRVWVTEFGWTVASLTQAQQATYLASSLRMARDYAPHFLDMLIVYADCDVQGLYGLYVGITTPFTARKAAAAFRDFAAPYDVSTAQRLN